MCLLLHSSLVMVLVYMMVYPLLLFSEDVEGYDELWLVGDNFMAETYRNHFKKLDGEWFMKENFEVFPFCSSKCSDNNANMLSHITNSLVFALNKHYKLPCFIIVIMDNDLVWYLQYEDDGATRMVGEWLEWIAEHFFLTCAR